MPHVGYRLLHAENGGLRSRNGQGQSQETASSGCSKLYQLIAKSSLFKKSLAASTLLMLLLVYLIWCSMASNDEVEDSSNIAESAIMNGISESEVFLCAESHNDSRLYMQNRPKSDYQNLSMIYFITPTYPRREQIPELTRLGQTLMHVPRLHWIVANDYSQCNAGLEKLLKKFGMPVTYLNSPMPEQYRKKKNQPRGVSNRRAAIQWIRQHNLTNGILYFGDDDNTYDLELFREIRETKKLSMFPVGLIGADGISAPVVRKGKVVAFMDSWVAGRRWPVDMAGFAVNLQFLAENPSATMPFKPGYEEDYFLRSLSLRLDLIEPKANNCTELLVWHTQTKKVTPTVVRMNRQYIDDRSNLEALFKNLKESGVFMTSESEGKNAVFSKNGKEKPLSTIFS